MQISIYVLYQFTPVDNNFRSKKLFQKVIRCTTKPLEMNRRQRLEASGNQQVNRKIGTNIYHVASTTMRNKIQRQFRNNHP